MLLFLYKPWVASEKYKVWTQTLKVVELLKICNALWWWWWTMATAIGEMMTIDTMKNNDSDDDDDDTMLMICQSSQPAWPLCGESAPLDASPPHRFWNQEYKYKNWNTRWTETATVFGISPDRAALLTHMKKCSEKNIKHKKYSTHKWLKYDIQANDLP